MTSSTYNLVRQAIAQKRQVVAAYQGHIREMCPHCIGRGKEGQEQALFFQFAGGSASGLPPGGQWRCLELSALTNVQIREGEWHSGPSHKKPQTCVKDVDLEAAP